MLEFRILGPFEVVEQQRSIALGGPRQRALLAILLLRRGAAVPSERLIDELWAERPPATAAKTLQGYVSHLRKALGPDVLVTRGGGYELIVEPEQVDAERFATLAAAGRRALADGDAAQARERLGEALALWRGEPLADLAYEPFAASEVARLDEARLAATEDRIDADLLLGHHHELVGELSALVARHPGRERLLGQLMLALYRSGRQTDALDAYARGRARLDEELGLEPGPELRALEQQILTHDPALAAPAGRRAASGAGSAPARRGRMIAGVGGLLLVAGVVLAIAALAGGSGPTLHLEPNSVVAIDAHTDHVAAQVPVGSRPGAIAYGSGSLWIANQDDETVSRVDPATLATQRTIAVPDPPSGIAAAAGEIWVTGPDPGRTSVSAMRIDPHFDTIDDTVRLGDVAAGTPASIAPAGESVWVAPYAGSLAELRSRTGAIVRQLDPNTVPAGIAVGDGATWLTDDEADNVTRVDPTGVVTAEAVGHGPGAIAVGDGAVWVADSGDDTVLRIDPSSSAVSTTIQVGDAPAGIAIGDGSVWVANSGDGTVTRIDPRTNRRVATIRVGGSPQAIVVARGRAWVTVDQRALPVAGVGGDQTLRVDVNGDAASLDPALAYDELGYQVLEATCAKLVNYRDRGGAAGFELVPEVARALPTRSADGRTYTFTIRPGFRFSPPSNAPVTAQTFKDSIERALSPRMHSPVAFEYADIAGAAAYMAGKAQHISGVTARGRTLTIRLTAPDADLPVRLTAPAMCAVPDDTPVDPRGLRTIPMAGPYRIASYTPGQGILLTRNPNYRGDRPHHFARIAINVGVTTQRAIAQALAGTADYATELNIGAGQLRRLTARYGAASTAARAGHRQLFALPGLVLDFLVLNSHRPLFASARMREAANYAIDRRALARLGDEFNPLPDRPAESYLPPGVPGATDLHVYPLTSDVAAARRLAAGHAPATAIYDACQEMPCQQEAQIVKTDLAAIGVRVVVRTMPDEAIQAQQLEPHAAWDIAWVGWIPDYPDPDAMLNALLEGHGFLLPFADPAVRAKLAAAARLSGPRRYLAYARLDANLVRNAAPWVAFGDPTDQEVFSARTGCQIYGPFGADLDALCQR